MSIRNKIKKIYISSFGASRDHLKRGELFRTYYTPPSEPSEPEPEPSSSSSGINIDIMPPDLVSWWRFEEEEWEEGVDNTVLDSSPNNIWHGQSYNGTLPISDGKSNQAAYFDGVDDYIKLSDSLNTEGFFDKGFSLVMWYYPYSFVGYSDTVSFAGPSYVGDDSTWSIDIVGDSIKAEASYKGSEQNAITLSPSITPNSWYHICFTYNYEDEIIRLYVNGIEKDNETYNHKFNFKYFQLVNMYSASNCKIDEFQLYNRALIESEISYLYNLWL